jgi:hypothetical protein
VEHVVAWSRLPPFTPSEGIQLEFTDDVPMMDDLCNSILESANLSHSLHPDLMVIALSTHSAFVEPGRSCVQAIQLQTSDLSIIFKV